MSVRPKSDTGALHRCPNCGNRVKDVYDEHWEEPVGFSCEYKQLPAYISDPEMRRAWQRAVERASEEPYWKKVMDEWIEQEAAKTKPLKWWEYPMAAALFGYLLVFSWYKLLDEALRKRGI